MAILHNIFAVFLFTNLLGVLKCRDPPPAPRPLTDMNSVLGGVGNGALLRLEVEDYSKCQAKFPKTMQPDNFYFELDVAEVHDDEGKEAVVTSEEREVNGSRYGLKGPAIRQTQIHILADGMALVTVTDMTPLNWGTLGQGTLYCAWRNDTASRMDMGMVIWQSQWQTTEMGTVARLNEAFAKGNMLFYKLDASMLQPRPFVNTWWAGAIHEFRHNHQNDVVFSQSVADGVYLRTTQVLTKQDGTVQVKRAVFDRQKATYLSNLWLTGTYGYNGSLHLFWKNLF